MQAHKGPTPDEVKADLDEGEMCETITCELLDLRLGENTLRAVADGTIGQKLLRHTLDEEDWDVVAHTTFLSQEARKSNLFEVMCAELVDALYGIVQYFRFCGARITDEWATDMHCLGLSDELVELPDQEYGICVAQSARTMGMTDREIVALLQYLRPDDKSTLQ